VGLVSGTSYEFKVQSRNSYGFSDFSEKLTLLAAFKPEAPDVVATANQADKIVVTWSMPITNGSPITGYRVYVREKGGFIFTH
jgi:hypothetical protein